MKNRVIFILVASFFLIIGCNNNAEKTEEVKEENHLLIGNDCLLKSEFKKSISEFNLHLQKDSISHEAFYGMGVAYEMQGNYQAAIDNYTNAINLNPTFTLAYYRRANNKKQLSDNSSALEDLKKAIDLKPDFVIAIIEAAHIEAPSKADQAIVDALSNSISKVNDSEVLYQYRGFYYYHLGKSKEALGDFEQALKLNPKNTESLYYSSIIYGDGKEYAKAITNLTTLISMNDTNKSAFLYRGIYYYNSEDNDKACSDLKRAAELGEQSAQGYVDNLCKK